jgi:hypothetical protein
MAVGERLRYFHGENVNLLPRRDKLNNVLGSKGMKGKAVPVQAMEAHRVVRRRGSHIL